MVIRLNALGVALDFDDVLRHADGGAVGRPHVARAIVSRGGAAHVSEAFDRFIGRGRPAFVEKVLPQFAEIAAQVHAVRGLLSIAHLKDRGTRSFIERLKFEGLDAVETRHPSHDGELRSRLTDIALRLGLLRTGGSDWHGDPEPGATHGLPRLAGGAARVAGASGAGPRGPPGGGRRMSGLIAPGSAAPDFTAPASDGRTYHLAELLRESRVLLVFYPGNDTPG